MKRLVVLAGALACAGCATVTPETALEESAFAALHATDAYQTVEIGQSEGRWHEAESSWAMGNEPSKRSVVLFMAGVELAHLGVGLYLEAIDAPRWVRRVFEGVSLGSATYNVVGNAQLGVGTSADGQFYTAVSTAQTQAASGPHWSAKIKYGAARRTAH
jgi:hypothetical protein